MVRPHIAYAQEWEKNARIDPLYAILTHPHATNGRWNADAFFATGETEIEFVLGYLRKIGLTPNMMGTFLDFGCGVGRTSRALARRFPAGIGIDISPRMIELARHYSTGDAVKASYVLNTDPDLRQMKSGSIDFLYSHLVLQHMPADLQEKFIGEFCRILRPGGVAVFQLPIERPMTWRRATSIGRMLAGRIKRLGRAILGGNTDARITMEMNALPKAVVENTIARNGCSVAGVKYSNSAARGQDRDVALFAEAEVRRVADKSAAHGYVSVFYLIRKASAWQTGLR